MINLSKSINFFFNQHKHGNIMAEITFQEGSELEDLYKYLFKAGNSLAVIVLGGNHRYIFRTKVLVFNHKCGNIISCATRLLFGKYIERYFASV